jgi:hypothetical protein
MEYTFYLYFSREDLRKIAEIKEKTVLTLSNKQVIAVDICKDGNVEIEFTDEVECDGDCDREPMYNEGYY